jgi:glycosyltransferase involved in cell wall biosynthesis
VAQHAGSVASAGYVLLHELLRRGLQVDLFAHRDHVPEPEGLRGERFAYHGFPQPGWLDAVDRLPGTAPAAARRLLYPFIVASWRRLLEPAAQAIHRRLPYDAVLALGTLPLFALEGAPVVSWLQSPFHTELDAIRRLREPIIASAGRPRYAAVTAWYRYYEFAQRHNRVRSDRILVPSEWSRRAMLEREGTRPPVEVLPYPIELETFRPDARVEIDWERPIVLWLGRIDPRKRADLLVDAFPLVRHEIPGARLLIVGVPGYFPNQLSVLERFPEVEYRRAVPRKDVPSLLRQAAVVVQTSENENFGSTVAEALACGVPVVVGPSNGTARYVDANSEVFESYEQGSIARAVVAALRRRRERPDEVRATTRASAERWFSAGPVAERLLATVEAAVADRRAARRGWET